MVDPGRTSSISPTTYGDPVAFFPVLVGTYSLKLVGAGVLAVTGVLLVAGVLVDDVVVVVVVVEDPHAATTSAHTEAVPSIATLEPNTRDCLRRSSTSSDCLKLLTITLSLP
jgi:hypothetical protein